jgi:hypothetical protein
MEFFISEQLKNSKVKFIQKECTLLQLYPERTIFDAAIEHPLAKASCWFKSRHPSKIINGRRKRRKV